MMVPFLILGKNSSCCNRLLTRDSSNILGCHVYVCCYCTCAAAAATAAGDTTISAGASVTWSLLVRLVHLSRLLQLMLLLLHYYYYHYYATTNVRLETSAAWCVILQYRAKLLSVACLASPPPHGTDVCSNVGLHSL